jgi:GxxExxY protein
VPNLISIDTSPDASLIENLFLKNPFLFVCPQFACHFLLFSSMPITCPFHIRNISRDEIDKIVMSCAYDTQNELGCLCDERVYENVLSSMLSSAGMNIVQTQIPVSVSFEGFEKIYRLDLVVEHALYELKVASGLVPLHDAQALHYAMMLSINHVKLLNFRTPRVQGRLRYNALLSDDRSLSDWNDSDWQSYSQECAHLHNRFHDLLNDWGTALESRLYEEALVHFSGGADLCSSRVPVVRSGIEVGAHVINSHAENIAFVVTGLPDPTSHRRHLEKLIRFLDLRAIQWGVQRRSTQRTTSHNSSIMRNQKMAVEWGADE